MKFVLATRNQDKVREIRDIIKGEEWELLSLADFPQTTEVVEDGKTFLSNALKKARSCCRETGIASLADDSGLEVDAIGGAPGILSSRFSGEKVSYRDNNEKLIRLLNGVPDEKRTARFRCVVVLADGEEEHWEEGVCEGIILSECRGDRGFGYDPLFFVPELGKTFSELDRDMKNGISHRGKAFRKMSEFIRCSMNNKFVA